jgi:hypothetical protein
MPLDPKQHPRAGGTFNSRPVDRGKFTVSIRLRLQRPGHVRSVHFSRLLEMSASRDAVEAPQSWSGATLGAGDRSMSTYFYESKY